MKDLKSLEKNVGNLPDVQQRLMAREMCYLRVQQKDGKTKTIGDVKEKRKQEMIRENIEKFGA